MMELVIPTRRSPLLFLGVGCLIIISNFHCQAFFLQSSAGRVVLSSLKRTKSIIVPVTSRNTIISYHTPRTLFATTRQYQNDHHSHKNQPNSTPSHSSSSNINNNNDPTSLFNNDIYRIASRTKSINSNFNPIHAAEHAERMLEQMISMYTNSNRKTARPNIDTFIIVLMGYANLKGYRWKKHDENKSSGSATRNTTGHGMSSFSYSSSAFTNLWGDEFVMDNKRVNMINVEKNGHDKNYRYDEIISIDDYEDTEDNDDNVEFDHDDYVDDNEQAYAHDYHSDNNKVNKSIVCSADRIDFIMSQLYQLQKSEIEAGNDITSLELNTDICNLCLLIYARCSYPQNDELLNDECKHISNESENNSDESKAQTDYKPLQQTSTYPFMLPSFQRGSYAERAEQLVKYMIYLAKQTDKNNIEPNAQTYSYLIWALSKQQPDVRANQRYHNIDGTFNHYATRASEWITHLETLYNNIQIKKGEYSHNKRLLRKYVYWAYSDVLAAWSKCSAKKSPRKVYKYMTTIESLCYDDQRELDEAHNNNKLDVDYKDDIGNKEDGGFFHKETRRTYYDEYEPKINRNVPLYPSAQCYTQTILALSKRKELGSAQRANQLLEKMLRHYDSGYWGKNKPGVYAFNGVISAWANCFSADNAEKVLNLMEKLHFDDDRPEYDYLKPDSVSYNTAIKAWINCKEDAAIFNAEKLMKRMEDRYNAVGDNFLDVKPDSYTYNTMITGWLRSDLGTISLQNAEELLHKMVQRYLSGETDLEPNQKIFSSIIDKWAKSDPSKNVAVKHSIALLNLMESLHERGCTQLKPDRVTYTNVIDAIARSRSPSGASQALSLLDTMERKYKDGDLNIKPSVQTYSCILLSLLNSNIQDKHIIAENIPKRMEAIGVTPNAFTFNYLIHVAAHVDGTKKKKMEAFKVALGAFQQLRKSKENETDSYTFTFFLKAIRHLLPPSLMRSSIAKETFLECANEGKMNDQVLSRLFWLLENQELRDLLGPLKVSNIRDIKASDLPPEWGENVKKTKSKTIGK